MYTQAEILRYADKALRAYPFSEHRDLIAFVVPCEEFYTEEDDFCTDFMEMVAVVDKDWLFDYIRDKYRTDNPRGFLQHEYTGEHSIEWFYRAIEEHTLAMIQFN